LQVSKVTHVASLSSDLIKKWSTLFWPWITKPWCATSQITIVRSALWFKPITGRWCTTFDLLKGGYVDRSIMKNRKLTS
jgi:hypothetical protein